jgi:hypothetical protein
MINSKHIFVELNELLPVIKERYNKGEVFYIGLRLANLSTPKVEVLLEELLPTLFAIIDTNSAYVKTSEKHPIWKEDNFKNQNLLSVFVCDSTSQTVYDSRYYQQSAEKYNLKRDKDARLLQFKQLDAEEKSQMAELIAAQITELQDDVVKGVEPEDNGPDSNWGEMPWDFQK